MSNLKTKSRKPRNMSLLANWIRYQEGKVQAGESVTIEVLESVATELLQFANQINNIVMLAKQPKPPAPAAIVQAQQPTQYDGYKFTKLPPPEPIKRRKTRVKKHA